MNGIYLCWIEEFLFEFKQSLLVYLSTQDLIGSPEGSKLVFVVSVNVQVLLISCCHFDS